MALPTDDELMRVFLDGTPYVFTGPDRWNTLGLGTTALYAIGMVYNRKRSGRVVLGGRPFLMRRRAFPGDPPVEWFVVDLFCHAEEAAASLADLSVALTVALREERFDRDRLAEMVRRFALRRSQARQALEDCLAKTVVLAWRWQRSFCPRVEVGRERPGLDADDVQMASRDAL
jgi:hypothetical protein